MAKIESRDINFETNLRKLRSSQIQISYNVEKNFIFPLGLKISHKNSKKKLYEQIGIKPTSFTYNITFHRNKKAYSKYTNLKKISYGTEFNADLTSLIEVYENPKLVNLNPVNFYEADTGLKDQEIYLSSLEKLMGKLILARTFQKEIEKIKNPIDYFHILNQLDLYRTFKEKLKRDIETKIDSKDIIDLIESEYVFKVRESIKFWINASYDHKIKLEKILNS